MAKILAYLLNTWDLDLPDRPPYQATEQQKSIFRKLLDTLDETLQPRDADDADDVDDADAADAADDVDAADAADDAKFDLDLTEYALEIQLSAFFESLLDHPLLDTDFSSPLLSAIAILGLKTPTSWYSAVEFTPVLSGIIYCCRLNTIFQAYIHQKAALSDPSGNQSSNQKTCLFWVMEFVQKNLLVDFKALPKPFN